MKHDFDENISISFIMHYEVLEGSPEIILIHHLLFKEKNASKNLPDCSSNRIKLSLMEAM